MAYEMRCADAGGACAFEAKAATEEQLIAKVAEHVKRKHGLKELPETLVRYVRSVSKQT